MRLYEPPALDDREEEVLTRIDGLRGRHGSHPSARRWVGVLRRVMAARAVRGSSSIEGYRVTVDDALAAAAGDEPHEASAADWKEILGYQEAMTYVLQLSEDIHFRYSADLLRALHFMLLKHDLSKLPGRWRLGPINVVDEARGEVVFEGPDVEEVPALVDRLAAGLDADETSPTVVRAAMAHLNLVMIHPFRDGNGRMARCLQTLVLARDRITHPEFSSIEEYLGRNTQAYYEVLAGVGGGAWRPDRDTRPWIRFCLTAHWRQAKTLEHRVDEIQKLWDALEARLERLGLPARALASVAEAAMGHRVRNSSYRANAEVSYSVATKDLKALVDAGLLQPRGERRGRSYVATEETAALGSAYRAAPRIADPFAGEGGGR